MHHQSPIMSDSSPDDIVENMAAVSVSSPVADDELMCMICSDLVVAAVRTSCCHRLFCTGCVKKWIERGTHGYHTCPNCRNQINRSCLDVDNAIEQRSASQQRCCPWKDEFICLFVGNRAEVDAHKDACRKANYYMRIPTMIMDLMSGSESAKESAVVFLTSVLTQQPDLLSALVDAHVIEMLISVLENGSDASISTVVAAFDSFADKEANRNLLLDNGVAGPLVQLIDRTPAGEQLVDSMLLLSKLAIFDLIGQGIIGDAGAIVPLIKHISTGTESVKYHAAGALWNICSKHVVNQTRAAEAGAFPPLITMMINHPLKFNVNAAGAIWNILAMNDPACNLVVVSDVQVLRCFVQLLGDSSVQDANRTFIVKALETLCTSTEDNFAPMVEASAAPFLIECLYQGHETRTKSAVFVLYNMLTVSPASTAVMVSMQIIPAMMAVLQRSVNTAVQGQLEGQPDEEPTRCTVLALNAIVKDALDLCEAMVELNVVRLLEPVVMVSSQPLRCRRASITLLGFIIMGSQNAGSQVAANTALLESLLTSMADVQLQDCALSAVCAVVLTRNEVHGVMAELGGVSRLEGRFRSTEGFLHTTVTRALRTLTNNAACKQQMSEETLIEIQEGEGGDAG